MIEVQEMTVEDFLLIPDSPIQRNTANHAERAQYTYGHLKELSPTHAKVSIAKWGNKQCVLDGHTRRYLWAKELLEAPKLLSCDIFNVQSQKEAEALYLMFDNKSATETSTDKIYGAVRRFGLEAKSTLILRGSVASPLHYLAFPSPWEAIKGMSMSEIVKPWEDSLKLIDSTHDVIKSVSPFPSWVMAAVLLTVRRDGAFALSFWEGYYSGEGIKNIKTVNGVHAAIELFRDAKANYVGHGGTSKIAALTPQLLYFYDQWALKKNIPINTRRKRGEKMYSLPKLRSVYGWFKDSFGELDHPALRAPAKK